MLVLRKIKLSVFLVMVVASTPTWAGPPFVTDDPEPVANQHWEISFAVNASRSQGKTSVGAPSIDINYGLLPDVQIHALPRLTYAKTSEDEHYGLDNTEIGIKYRFFNRQYDHSTWMVGIYPMLLLPTADKTLNPDERKIQTFLPLWIQRDSKDWTIYGGAGYRINQGSNTKNSYFVGVAALNHLSENLLLGGELFHETPSRIGEKATVGFNLGGKYDLSDHFHLLFSAGKALINAYSTNQFSSYLALQATY
ncbi:MAG TPA: hypothetical protein VGK14_04045 [Novimethylophilus sp.]|uniref:hypothetical protein n=1 Tax=Novimethylophilus sp. TaxID=2137426 RepID=UPI002F427C49